jgi:broad specificity phosphatase PhoE
MLNEMYLIRHGLADRDPAIPYESEPGPSLNARGRYEVRAAATFLAGRGIRHLYVSPFLRTQQTAEQIGEQLGLPVSTRSLLAEAPRSEAAADVRARIQAFLAALATESLPTIGIVSHGTPLLMLRGELTGEPVDLRPSQDGQPPLPTAGIWRAWRDGDGWRVDLAFAPSESDWRRFNEVL